MSNRVITIGSAKTGQNTLSAQEVYLDISMDSKQVVKNGNQSFKTDKLINVAAVQNSLKQIFTWIPGERIINPEFGSNLRKLLYEQITSITEERIVAEIKQCVSRWEPRVTIEQIVNVSDIEDTEDNTIRLDIKYKISGLDDIFTYTYEQNNYES